MQMQTLGTRASVAPILEIILRLLPSYWPTMAAAAAEAAALVRGLPLAALAPGWPTWLPQRRPAAALAPATAAGCAPARHWLPLTLWPGATEMWTAGAGVENLAQALLQQWCNSRENDCSHGSDHHSGRAGDEYAEASWGHVDGCPTMVASRSGLCREWSASGCLSTRVAAMAIPAAAGCRSAAKDIATGRDEDVDGGSERREPLGCSAAALRQHWVTQMQTRTMGESMGQSCNSVKEYRDWTCRCEEIRALPSCMKADSHIWAEIVGKSIFEILSSWDVCEIQKVIDARHAGNLAEAKTLVEELVPLFSLWSPMSRNVV